MDENIRNEGILDTLSRQKNVRTNKAVPGTHGTHVIHQGCLHVSFALLSAI